MKKETFTILPGEYILMLDDGIIINDNDLPLSNELINEMSEESDIITLGNSSLSKISVDDITFYELNYERGPDSIPTLIMNVETYDKLKKMNLINVEIAEGFPNEINVPHFVLNEMSELGITPLGFYDTLDIDYIKDYCISPKENFNSSDELSIEINSKIIDYIKSN